MKYRIYVLRSSKNNKRYCGFTSKEVEKRLEEHNAGHNLWARQNGPFVLLYQEEFNTKAEALRRERYLKTGNGRKFLDSLRVSAPL